MGKTVTAGIKFCDLNQTMKRLLANNFTPGEFFLAYEKTLILLG